MSDFEFASSPYMASNPRAFSERPTSQTVSEFNSYMQMLYKLALPSDQEVLFFHAQMKIAGERGMNYREGLEFVIRMRQGGAD